MGGIKKGQYLKLHAMTYLATYASSSFPAKNKPENEQFPSSLRSVRFYAPELLGLVFSDHLEIVTVNDRFRAACLPACL